MMKLFDIILKKLIPFAAGKGDYRSNLKGIHIKNNIVFAADGYILACKDLSDDNNVSNEDCNMFIPIERFIEAMNMISKKDYIRKITMEQIEDKLIFFNANRTSQITINVSKEEQPAIEKVWPKDEPEAIISFDAKHLEKVCKLAEGNYLNKITFKIYESCLTYKTESGFYGIIMALRQKEKDLL